jgi:hypothetical protein
MTHPHLDQRSVPVYQHPMVFTPYQHLVNAPVSALDSHTSALIPQHYSEPPTVVDGEVITSSLTTRTMVRDDTEPTTRDESRPSVLRRVIDDPYWILMTLMAVLGLSITATVIYGVIQIILAIGQWFHAHGTTLGAIAALIIVVMLCGGGATAAKCTGIHCGGCKG